MNGISKMNDEELYLEATNEVEGENKSTSLWAKVMALSEGDEEKAKYKYIKLRVEQLANERKNAAPKFTKKTVDEFDLKYMPVDEFSKIKSIPKDKVIEMIRDGFYVGQIKNDEWYVSREEVGKNEKPKPASRTSQKTDDSKKEYIPVEEFSEYKGITSEKAIAMIRDGFYQGQIIDDKWYVAYSEVSNVNEPSSSVSSGFFSKLANGDFGLAKTYWLYGVLVGVIANVLSNVITSISGLVIFMVVYTAYEIPVVMGVWRASSKYQGPRVWAILAKIAVVLGAIMLVAGLLVIAGWYFTPWKAVGE